MEHAQFLGGACQLQILNEAPTAEKPQIKDVKIILVLILIQSNGPSERWFKPPTISPPNFKGWIGAANRLGYQESGNTSGLCLSCKGGA